MNDIEQRAHDIAVRILPYTLKEFEPNFSYLTYDDEQKEHRLRSSDIVEEYSLLYEALLKDLKERDE